VLDSRWIEYIPVGNYNENAHAHVTLHGEHDIDWVDDLAENSW